MAYFNLYKNNPTAGGTDGSKVVSGNPIITPYVDLASSEMAVVKLAARCDPGYATLQNTVIAPAAPETTLSASASTGAASVSVSSATGLQIGNRIAIGAGETQETKRITAIDGTTLSLDSALTNAQDSGAAVVCLSKYRIALSLDDDGEPAGFGEYGAAMTITDTIGDTNYIIHAQVQALSAEAIPYNDVAAWLGVSYKVGEV